MNQKKLYPTWDENRRIQELMQKYGIRDEKQSKETPPRPRPRDGGHPDDLAAKH